MALFIKKSVRIDNSKYRNMIVSPWLVYHVDPPPPKKSESSLNWNTEYNLYYPHSTFELVLISSAQSLLNYNSQMNGEFDSKYYDTIWMYYNIKRFFTVCAHQS